MLLLCALVAGSSSVWAQSDYSALYTSNVTLPTSGTNVSSCTVVVDKTNYDGTKLGKSGSGASASFTAPKGTKYIHLHVAAWKDKSTGFTYKVGDGSAVSISNITSDSGISSNTPFTFSGDATTSNYYKVITLGSALESATTITFASTSERVVFWGVNTEAASSDPSSNAAFADETPEINFPATKTYSQAPTTAAGYSGTITYSMTANTAGATINSSTGLVTVTQGGSVTVKALAAAVAGSFAGSEATYTLTVNDTRTSAELAWSAASADVTYGADDNIFPTLTNTHSVPVTYSSSNMAAATIDESGVITLKDYTGETTISAIFEGNDDYLAQTVTYTLNVDKAPFSVKDGVFDFVEAATASEDYGSGVTTTSSSTEYVTTDKTWTAGNVTMVTSKVSGNGYRWWKADGTLRFYNGSKATFSVPDGYAITKIVTTGANFDKANVGTLSGTTWTGAANEVALSVTATRSIKTITVTYGTTAPITITAAGWASFSCQCEVAIPDGVTAYYAQKKDASNVTLKEIAGGYIPANTGVVVSGAANTYNATVTSTGATLDGDNILKPWLASGTPEDAKYYTLAVDGSGDPMFKTSSGGTLAAGKAYLVMPDGARELKVDFGNTTGVNDVRSKMADGRGDFYNLNGQRVSQPTRGLYIVNGKKVVIR